MIDRACTPGWTHRTSPTTVSAYCGCGWTADGLPSKTAAKAAQRDHRFPPRCDRCMLPLNDDGCCPEFCDALDCGCGRDDRTEPHEFGPGCDAWDPDVFGDDDYDPTGTVMEPFMWDGKPRYRGRLVEDVDLLGGLFSSPASPRPPVH